MKISVFALFCLGVLVAHGDATAATKFTRFPRCPEGVSDNTRDSPACGTGFMPSICSPLSSGLGWRLAAAS
jgi:hypothetical protein